MHWVDWSMIAAYVAVATAIGFVFIHRARSSVAECFVAGRSRPWWVAGTSPIAASFAADAPFNADIRLSPYRELEEGSIVRFERSLQFSQFCVAFVN